MKNGKKAANRRKVCNGRPKCVVDVIKVKIDLRAERERERDQSRVSRANCTTKNRGEQSGAGSEWELVERRAKKESEQRRSDKKKGQEEGRRRVIGGGLPWRWRMDVYGASDRSR